MAFAAHVLETRVFPMARRGFRLIATVTDDDFAARRNTPKSLASLVFFSYRKSYVDWVQRKLHAGALLVVAGEPSVYDNRLQFTHPDLLTINPVQSQSENGEWNDGFGDPANPPLGNLKYDAQTIDEALKRVCRPRPVYHATSRISSEHIHESVLKYMDALRGAEYLATQNAGNFLDNPTQEGDFDIPQIDREIQIKVLGNAIPDIIPEDFREEYGLMHRAEAFMAIHDPVDRKNFDNALQTLRYEEALICQTALVKSRDASRKSKATACPETRLKDDFIASLPFALTNGQQQVIADISADMAHDYPMQRLLQGEVGSGKTVVAVAAMMQAVGSGGQAVLVAPTQVLAEQHYASISTMVSKLGKSDANSSDNQKNLDDANARRSNKRSAQSSKDGEFDAKTIHNNAVDKGVQLADLLDLAASDDVETGFSGKGNDIFGTKDGEIPVFLLTGSMRLAERRRVLAAAASGHALYRRGDARRIFQEFPGAEPHLGGDRRTAPLRCGTARIVEFQGFYGASSVGHDGHADSAHRSHDLVRRSRHFLADRTSRRPQADSHIRGAGRQCVVDGRNVCPDSQAHRRGGTCLRGLPAH